MAIALIRACILYIVIAFAIRLMGKHQLGELSPSELVVTILISNIASIPVEDTSVPMIIGIIPIMTLVCLDVIISTVMLRYPRFRRMMIGSPRVIISEGVLIQRELKRLRYTVDDVYEAMREQQIFDIGEIHYAIVETNGKINFMKKEDYAAAEKADIGKGGSTEDPPAVIVRDGIEDATQLSNLGLGEGWLKQKLREQNLSIKEVFLMTADKNGKMNIIKRQRGM